MNSSANIPWSDTGSTAPSEEVAFKVLQQCKEFFGAFMSPRVLRNICKLEKSWLGGVRAGVIRTAS
eukprot:9954155-Lingulodinium_polyedra.AAC.1